MCAHACMLTCEWVSEHIYVCVNEGICMLTTSVSSHPLPCL